jgi:tetratricopeptide (TPR) repeat protein
MPFAMRVIRLVLLLVMASRAVAYAAPDVDASSTERLARAKEHFALGRSHYELGDWDAAVREFKESYLQQPLPLLLFNIAQSHRRAGHVADAITFYRQFLALEPNHALAEWRAAQGFLNELVNASPTPAPPKPTLPPLSPPPVVATTTLTPAPSPPPAPPPEVSPPPAAIVIDAQATEAPAAPPHRRRTRLWIGLGVAAGVVVVGTAIALGVTLSRSGGPPASDLGAFPVLRH